MAGFHLRWLLAAVVAGVIAGLATAVASGGVQVVWIVVAVVVVLGFALAVGALRRRRVTYTITTERLAIESGLLARQLHETQLERVQNVSFRQSLLERLLGVGTVDFDTAAGAKFSFSFAGVRNPREVVRVVSAALRERPRQAPDGS